jgi:hypothetical protein
MNSLSRSHEVQTRPPARASWNRLLRALLCLTALIGLAPHLAAAQGAIGGTTLYMTNPQNPLAGTPPVDPNDPTLYTWTQLISLTGTGWGSAENVTVYMYGPLNSLEVAPSDRAIGTILTAPDGSIGMSYEQGVSIPYDGGVTGYNGNNLPNVPLPGNYEIHAVGAGAGLDNIFDRASAGLINLCPQPLGPVSVATNEPYGPNWEIARGGRDGLLADHSPERLDPEWLSIAGKKPVAFYATVAPTDTQGGNQPAFISYQEWPGTHYAHDLNLELVPDEPYRWILGPNNFASNPEDANHGRVEWEWETQNGGNPFLYGTGNIGIPLWATATSGDRVYTVGRWPMDNGHPDTGDRTEIHPARLLATMRQRNTVVPFPSASGITRASQVDIYVSGHGGGANQYYDGLEDLLDNHGMGNGRIQDFMPDLFGNSLIFDTYYNPGPLTDPSFFTTLAELYELGSTDLIRTVAGPSGIATDTNTGLPTVWDHSMPLPANLSPWTQGPEERPINDMDYDFDVPLPAAPPGASVPLVRVTTHAEHTTGVTEVVTYTTPGGTSGLPTVAHVHLPYNGADNGIYARTLNFYWNTFNPPGEHFVVQINDVNNTNPYDNGSYHAWNLWADICGQWIFLTGLNPSPGFNSGFVSQQGDKVTGFGAAKFDVYLDPSDLLRVFAYGYEVHSFDYLYGVTPEGVNQTRYSAYQAGNNVAENQEFSDGDDGEIGGAIFFQSPSPVSAVVGPQNAPAQPVAGASQYNIDFTVSHITPTTSTTLTSSENPSTYGDTVTFTAAVTNTSSSSTPTGTLVMTVDGSPVTPAISGFANVMTAVYSISTLLPTSSHTVTANYTNVDGNFGPSGPASLIQTVRPAPLNIRANNASRLVADANPPFSATYTGFVNGDSPASLAGTLNCTTIATQFSPAGNYPINCSGQSSPNYVITYVPGALTITATAASVTNMINDVLAGQCIDNAGIASALTSKLPASGANSISAINTLGALTNQINAQAGKHIATSCKIGNVTFDPVTVLLLDVQALIDSIRVGAIADPITGYVVNASIVGVPGAVLSIQDAHGNTVATATSDITGYYYFSPTGVLFSGSSYNVTVTGRPAGFTSSTPAAYPYFTWTGTGMMIGNFVLN